MKRYPPGPRAGSLASLSWFRRDALGDLAAPRGSTATPFTLDSTFEISSALR